ncbi:MAG: avidin/streptavidin family protein [Acidimicrobiales bacterium]
MWLNELGGVVLLRTAQSLPGGRYTLEGQYRSAVGDVSSNDLYDVTGWMCKNLATFCVMWDTDISATTWAGRRYDEGGIAHLAASWTIVREHEWHPYPDVDGTVPIWKSFLTNTDHFHWTGPPGTWRVPPRRRTPRLDQRLERWIESVARIAVVERISRWNNIAPEAAARALLTCSTQDAFLHAIGELASPDQRPGSVQHLKEFESELRQLDDIRRNCGLKELERRGLEPRWRSVTRAIVFEDIVRSSARATYLGTDTWADLRTLHDTFVTTLVTTCEGSLANPTGDGVLATFDTVGHAIRFARRLLDRKGAVLPLAVRIGIHWGEVGMRGTDVAGAEVNLASRICSKARSDQVFASAEVKNATRAKWRDTGEYRLKGFGRRRLFELEPPAPRLAAGQ